MRITCRVHPRAVRARVEWDGVVAGVWVSEPAADGHANRAVVLAVARWLEVSPRRVRIVVGTRSRLKVVDVDGVDAVPAPTTPDQTV